MTSSIKLSEVPVGTKVRIKNIELSGDKRIRFEDIGLCEETFVEILFDSPSRDPRAYLIRGAVIALRNEGTEYIYAEPE